jgi:hypothetical protein
MKSIKQQLEDLVMEIDGDVHYGECFYEKEMLDDFLKSLFKLQLLAVHLYTENVSEMLKEELRE